jgi:hypothetical protein
MKVQSIPEGNKWFNDIIQNLQTTPRHPKIDFEIIIIQAIVRYLNGTLDFALFIDVIKRIGDKQTAQSIPEVNQLITQILPLSQYISDPKANQEEIMDVFNDVVKKLEVNR